MNNEIDDGGPAFPAHITINRASGKLVPYQSGNNDFHMPGMTLRDYFAIHGVQPGCGELASMAGLYYSQGAVWSNSETRVDNFDSWFCGLPLTERLDLFARVKYAMADAMLKVRQS